MDYSKEIKEIYRSLPDELGQIVGAQETSTINDEIAKNHNLSIQQRLEMGDEITMRLLGITPKEVFAVNLENRLKVNSEIAQKISDEVKTRILAKIPEKILIAQEASTQTRLNKSAEVDKTEKTSVPEIAPEIHPMVEPTPPPTQPGVSLPDYRYADGKDPYREPLQ